ncbi:NUDIX domain-containing protein [Halovivax gelatinilyticus]|uniref:NUDIX domain-containing protein n=1 Tax=Halovivax gelatinilyticus TaxID=2961597 RepID=UPI0020CA734B|nr:NUDIX domain-containing protein [Halovivax gelatinilyticus]
MDATERSRERLRHLQSRLAERDEFAVIDDAWDVSAETYERERVRFDEEALGGAGAWMTNDDGAVLLVRNEGDDGWSDPGGKREAGETFAEAAEREVREETGVECRLRGVREFHRIEHRSPDERGSIYEAIVIFDAEYVSGEPKPRAGEIADVAWFTDPPERVLYEQVRTRPYPGR